METVKGTAIKTIYKNAATGYGVVLCRTDDGHLPFVGDLASVTQGTVLEAEGKWQTHPRYGKQFKVSSWTESYPENLDDIKLYISSFAGGVGEVYAEKIVNHFGKRALDIMDNHSDMLLAINGIGSKTLEKIKKTWSIHKEKREVFLFLVRYGLSANIAHKVFAHYGPASIKTIKANPYRLVDDIRGVSFEMADKFALAAFGTIGFNKEHRFRLRSGLLYTMKEWSNSGNVYATRAQLTQRGTALLGVDASKVKKAIDEMLAKHDLVEPENDHIFTKDLYDAENSISAHIKRLLSNSTKLTINIREIEVETQTFYDDAQLDAILYAMEHKVMVLTGGPGTGKTTVTNGIIAALEKNNLKVRLAAPTGRAAKRMTETTKKDALTIHRLLEGGVLGDNFNRNERNQLEGDVLIVDEASMVDTRLMASLLKAIPNKMRLILVGDTNQLPSVGPGTVLRDIIDSGAVPVVQLTKIFRQAQSSNIIRNCHQVNQGVCPGFRYRSDSDFFFVEEDNADNIEQQIVNLVETRLPNAYGVKPTDIQVLAPQKTTNIGTYALNRALQKALNHSSQLMEGENYTFKLGDKVIQMTNNYEKEVFNGDIGYVSYVDPSGESLRVSFEGKEVDYVTTNISELALAYAITIHKSQGSEYPIVVMPLHTANYYMLERHLAYTGFSRARKLLIVVGSKSALMRAAEHEVATRRQTMLKERLLAA